MKTWKSRALLLYIIIIAIFIIGCSKRVKDKGKEEISDSSKGTEVAQIEASRDDEGEGILFEDEDKEKDRQEDIEDRSDLEEKIEKKREERPVEKIVEERVEEVEEEMEEAEEDEIEDNKVEDEMEDKKGKEDPPIDYGHSKRTYYQVTFIGKNEEELESQRIEKGCLISAISPPAIEGYDFIEWCSDCELLKPWKFDEDRIDKDISLYGKWEKIKSSDASISSIKLNGVEASVYGDKINSYQVEIEASRNKDSIKEEDFEIRVNDLKAKSKNLRVDEDEDWIFEVIAEDGTSVSYKIKIVETDKLRLEFDLDGGNIDGNGENIVYLVEKEKTIGDLIEKPEKAYEIFVNWKQGIKVIIESYEIVGDMMLKATWEVKKISIGGVGVSLNSEGEILDYEGLFWKDSTNTLTMNKYAGARILSISSNIKSINIELVGENTISHPSGHVLDFPEGINFSGSGSLKIVGGGECLLKVKDIRDINIRDAHISIEQIRENNSNNLIRAIEGNVSIYGEGKLSIETRREGTQNYHFRGINGSLSLYDKASAIIKLIDKVNRNDVIGVKSLSLNGSGECEIELETSSTGTKKAIESDPGLENDENYGKEGSWDSQYVKYYKKE